MENPAHWSKSELPEEKANYRTSICLSWSQFNLKFTKLQRNKTMIAGLLYLMNQKI